MKLLVNAPTGFQELITIGQGGCYFDHSRVLWDERVDGPMPEVVLNGMVRDRNQLIFVQKLYDEYIANQQ